MPLDGLIARQVGLLRGLGACTGVRRSAIHCAISSDQGAEGNS